MAAARSSRSLRNAETRRKKNAHAIPRAKVTRSQGNTAGCRKRLKKLAAKAMNARVKAAETAAAAG